MDNAGDLGESYARINRLLIAGLRALGVGGVAVVDKRIGRGDDDAETANPGFLPCFHHPSVGEITLDGRKLVGSAQWRSDGALLQHGSILVEDDQMQLSSLLIQKGEAIPKPATLREVLGCAPTDRDIARVLFDAVRDNEDANAREIEIDAALMERAQALQGHYLDDDWTWRR
jgi:lipoate-protein ligase A